jgi:hypothetical protein
VKRNVFEAMHCLCSNLGPLNIELETDVLKEAAAQVLEAKQPFPKVYCSSSSKKIFVTQFFLRQDLFDKIEILWKSAAIEGCLKRSSDFQLLDSAKL